MSSTLVIEINTNPTPTPSQPAVFDPPALTVHAYDTIIWHNGDTQAHYPAPIVNGSVQEKGWFDNQIAPDGTSDNLAPGPNPTDPKANYILKYACYLHQGETGQITVQPQQ